MDYFADNRLDYETLTNVNQNDRIAEKDRLLLLLLLLLLLRSVSALFNRNCPSARCASAANVVCRDFDVFKTNIVSLSRILQ
jgi:hypothetical protein